MNVKASDLIKSFEKKQDRKKISFDVILNRCETFIKRHVMVHNLNCFFEIPEFVIGYPLYSLEECVRYIYEKLIHNGFYVKYYFPNILYISWNKDEVTFIETVDAKATRIQNNQFKQIEYQAKKGKNVKHISEFKPCEKFKLAHIQS